MSNDKVVPLKTVTSLDLPAERVLQAAVEAGLSDVVILGYTKDDDREYFASSIADGGSVLWLMKRLERELLSVEASEAPPRPVDPEGKVLKFSKPE